MYYFEQWAKNNLTPEAQEKFFAEQDKIKKDSEDIERWIYRPEEAMGLSEAQIEFLHDHEIAISTAYIGMVRIYHENRTIFQTSAMASIANTLTAPEGEGIKTDYENLSSQVREYLDLLMSASPETQKKLLENNMPLFGAGELDQIKGMCGIK